MPLKSKEQTGKTQATAQEDGVMDDKADWRMYKILFEQAGVALYLHDLDGTILNVNAAACEQTGYSKKELLAMQIFDLDPEGASGKEQIVTTWKNRSAGERINFSAEHQKKDGTIYPVELSNNVICYAEQNYILATAIDSSHWKSTEQSLRASETQYRALFEKAPIGYQSLDEQGKILKINQAWLDMLGYHRNEVIGRSFGDFLSPEWQNHFKKNFPRFKAVGEILGVEFEMIKKDGTTALFSFNGKIARDSDGHFQRTHCVLENITERKILEDKLQQAQKLESIGSLAGGIAHEFNNILSIIMGNNELIMEELSEWSLARESAEEIRNASLRARDVVKQLLTFSRQDRVKKRVFDAREVICESLKLLRAATPKNIAIETDLAKTVHPIYGSETQLSQILINLGKNSADAIVTGIGTISVSLHNCDVKHENGDRYQVCLKIGDTGIGMSNEVCKRIFDPYFTTKEVGKGTGIGLSVVHGIVESHGGTIEVDSRPQHGTTFTILLPAAENSSNV